jgi:hypothetical protein
MLVTGGASVTKPANERIEATFQGGRIPIGILGDYFGTKGGLESGFEPSISPLIEYLN